jgi:MATE family multidrug resistance protein
VSSGNEGLSRGGNTGEIAPVTGVVSEAKRLWKLGWPVALGMVGMTTMGVADMIMVGHLGKPELAAVAAGHLWGFTVVMFGRGVLHGLDPVVAQAHGAGDVEGSRRALASGLGLSLLLAIPLFIWHLFGAAGLGLLGQPESVLPMAGAYCKALAWGVLPLLVFHTYKQVLQGHGFMMPASIALIVCNVVNLFLNWVFIYGNLGAPKLGVTGSGVSTSLCQIFLVVMVVYLGRKHIETNPLIVLKSLSLNGLWKMLGVGIPVGVQISIEAWAFVFAGVMMGWLGEVELAAHTVALNLASLPFMAALGISAAASTRIGNLVGAGLEWAKAAWIALALGASIMSFSMVAFLFAPRFLATIYTSAPDVLALSAVLIPMAGAFQLCDGLQVVAFGALRGAGDIRVPAILAGVAFWCIGLPAGGYLAFSLGLGAVGIWYGFLIGITLISGMLAIRIHRLSKRKLERVIA